MFLKRSIIELENKMDLRNFWEENDPDFINDEGTKWWIDRDLTNYAQNPDAKGISLDVQAWVLQTSDGYMTRVLVNKDHEICDESQNLEALAVKIDVRKFLKGDL
jgi:hypothetical protein